MSCRVGQGGRVRPAPHKRPACHGRQFRSKPLSPAGQPGGDHSAPQASAFGDMLAHRQYQELFMFMLLHPFSTLSSLPAGARGPDRGVDLTWASSRAKLRPELSCWLRASHCIGLRESSRSARGGSGAAACPSWFVNFWVTTRMPPPRPRSLRPTGPAGHRPGHHALFRAAEASTPARYAGGSFDHGRNACARSTREARRGRTGPCARRWTSRRKRTGLARTVRSAARAPVGATQPARPTAWPAGPSGALTPVRKRPSPSPPWPGRTCVLRPATRYAQRRAVGPPACRPGASGVLLRIPTTPSSGFTPRASRGTAGVSALLPHPEPLR